MTTLHWALLGALVVIVSAWPAAQRLRHPRIRPLAAYFIFLSVFALVGGVLLGLASYTLALMELQPSLTGWPRALGGVLLATIPGSLAGAWAIRRPPRRSGVEPD